MTKKAIFALQGSPLQFKIAGHREDSSKLVLKSKRPEIGNLLAKLAGETASTIKGSVYFITTVDRKVFLDNLGTIVGDFLSGNIVMLDQMPPAATPGADPVGDYDDGDFGEDDGDY